MEVFFVDKLLTHKIMFWILILIIMIIIISTLLVIRTNTKPSFNLDVKEPLNYFPYKKMKKIFKNESNNEFFIHFVDLIKEGRVHIKQVDRLSRVLMVYDIGPDSIRLVFTRELDDKTFEVDYGQGLLPNRDDIILMSPVQEGTHWSDNDGGIYEIIKKNAVVKTPAGTFKTVVVKYANGDFTVKEYYAKDIGLVKIVVNNFDAFELVSYE